MIDIANSIVFYDYEDAEIDLQGLYDYIVNWAQNLGEPFTRAGITGKNIRSTGRKLQTFKHCNKVLYQQNFKDISSIGLYSALRPIATHDEDFLISASIDVQGINPCIVISASDDLIAFNTSTMISMAENLINYLQPQYGFAFQRHINKGPVFYAGGAICNGGYSKEEKKQITTLRVFKTNHYRYQIGDFRDVYPFNFVGEAHLNRTIQDKKLIDWIHESLDHGILKPLSDKLWYWEIAEQNIELVRNALKQENLLISYLPR